MAGVQLVRVTEEEHGGVVWLWSGCGLERLWLQWGSHHEIIAVAAAASMVSECVCCGSNGKHIAKSCLELQRGAWCEVMCAVARAGSSVNMRWDD